MTARRSKLNCWEFKKCGRQPGGFHERDMGRCPAAEAEILDGIHEGTNAGRACWVIAGTMCRGQVQGTFAQKFKDCSVCEFYNMVKFEEFPNFILSSLLIAKMMK